MTDKKTLSEYSIYSHFVLPGLIKAGWDYHKLPRENVYFTGGYIFVNDKKTAPGK